MLNQTNLNDYKQRVIADFNSRTNYDNDWRYRFANRLVELAKLEGGQRILDVATGTGIVAIAAAKIVGSQGKVIGVDISTGMLSQARTKIEVERLENIEFQEADADYLNFGDRSFNAILCSSAIVYLTDIPAALHKWHCFLKPGGIVAFSCLAETSPITSVLFRTKLQTYGILIPNPNKILGTPEKCYKMLQEAGFKDIEIQTEQLGLYLSEAENLWNGNLNSALSFEAFRLPLEKLDQCKTEYIAEVEALATEQGIWNDITTFFVLARK